MKNTGSVIRFQPGQRARSEDAKHARRAELLAAARRQLLAVGFDGFTMADLAAEAKVAKGTAYLYFTTREELLLTVLTEDLDAAFTSFERAVLAMESDVSPAQIGAAFHQSLTARPTTLPLLQLLHTKLERNVSLSALQVFKVFLRQCALSCAQAVEDRLRLREGAGITLFLRAHALAIGLYQLADRPPPVEALFKRLPDLAIMRHGFETEFVGAVAALAASAQRESLVKAA